MIFDTYLFLTFWICAEKTKERLLKKMMKLWEQVQGQIKIKQLDVQKKANLSKKKGDCGQGRTRKEGSKEEFVAALPHLDGDH